MADALRLDLVLNSREAETALAQFETSLLKAGNTAEQAASKVARFEQSLKERAGKDQAVKALREVATQTQGVADTSVRATQASDALTGAIRRYVAPAAIGAAVVKTLEWADNLVNLSHSTGISMTNLQKFEIIGRTTGVTMDQMAAASLQLSNRLAGGDKSAVEGVKTLGLNLDKLIASKPDDVMLSFAKALGDVENPQQRVALAMDVMGRSAGNMLPMLLELSKRWDDVDAKLSDSAVGSLADADDALDDLMGSGKGLIATVLVPFAPLLTGISTVLQPLASLLSSFMRDITSPLRLDTWKAWTNDLRDAAASLGYIVGLGPGIRAILPGAPGAPSRWGMPSPIAVPGSPMDGAAGQSWSHLNRGGGGGGGSAPDVVMPYTANQWAAIQQVLQGQGWMNAWVGAFPGFAPALPNTQTPNWTPYQGTAAMHAPGGGAPPWLSSWMQGGGGAHALGFLSNLFGGAQGARTQMGGNVGGMLGSAGGPMGSFWGQQAGQMAGRMVDPEASGWSRWGGLLGGNLTGNLLDRMFGGGGRERQQIGQMRGTSEFSALEASATRLGISMDAVFSARRVEDFQRAVQDVTTQIGEQEAQQARVQAAMEKYGLTLADMGPTFRQTELDKIALELTKDFEALIGAGADLDAVIAKMGPHVGDFVHSAIEMGGTVPKEMEPIIKRMIEMGMLTDRNGEKFTDLSQIPFAKDLNQQFSELLSSIERLIARLSGVETGFDRATDAAADFNREAGNLGGSGDQQHGDAILAAQGGVFGGRGKVLFFDRGGFVPRGTDSVPAMLTPGEMVVARDTVKALARGRGSSLTINLHIAGYLDSPKVQRDLIRVITDGVDRDVRMRRTG